MLRRHLPPTASWPCALLFPPATCCHHQQQLPPASRRCVWTLTSCWHFIKKGDSPALCNRAASAAAPTASLGAALAASFVVFMSPQRLHFAPVICCCVWSARRNKQLSTPALLLLELWAAVASHTRCNGRNACHVPLPPAETP